MDSQADHTSMNSFYSPSALHTNELWAQEVHKSSPLETSLDSIFDTIDRLLMQGFDHDIQEYKSQEDKSQENRQISIDEAESEHDGGAVLSRIEELATAEADLATFGFSSRAIPSRPFRAVSKKTKDIDGWMEAPAANLFVSVNQDKKYHRKIFSYVKREEDTGRAYCSLCNKRIELEDGYKLRRHFMLQHKLVELPPDVFHNLDESYDKLTDLEWCRKVYSLCCGLFCRKIGDDIVEPLQDMCIRFEGRQGKERFALAVKRYMSMKGQTESLQPS